MSTPTILVASATANTGSKVVEQLSATGKCQIRALTRNPDSDAAKALAKLPHVTVVKGDFDDAASLKPALQGVSRAFLVSAPGEDTQYDREVAFIAAATEANLEAVVRISTAAFLISMDTSCVYAKAHARIEKYIEEHKSRVIDLLPNFFMTNLLWAAAEAQAAGRITYPMTQQESDTMPPVALVDPRDVAGAAVACLLSTKEQLDSLLKARMVEVHGPTAVTFSQLFDAIGKANGSPLALNPMDPEEWSKLQQGYGLSKLMADSFCNTVRATIGKVPDYRPKQTKSSPALAAIWQPKYSMDVWVKDHHAAFAQKK